MLFTILLTLSLGPIQEQEFNSARVFSNLISARRRYSDEIEFPDEQLGLLKRHESELRKRREEVLTKFSTPSRRAPHYDHVIKERNESMRKLLTEMKKKFDAVYTPEQRKQMTKIDKWYIIGPKEYQFRWFRNRLLNDALEITENQKRELETIIPKADRGYEEGVSKRKAKAEEKIMSILTASQRKKLKDIGYSRLTEARKRRFEERKQKLDSDYITPSEEK